MVGRAVHAPAQQHVARDGGANTHPDRAVGHPVVHLDDLGALKARVRHEVQLDDARPLDVVVRTLVRLRLLIKKGRRFDARDDKVPKLPALAIKGPDVPTQTGVHQGKGHDDPLGLSAAHRVVADGDRSLGVDRPADRGQHIHPGVAQSGGRFARQQRLQGLIRAVHAIAEAESQRRQHARRCVVEQRGERLPDAVNLVATVKGDVLRRDFPVQRQVARRPGRSHAEALNQVWATDLTEEVEPEVDVGQPLALGVAQVLDALGLSHRRLLIQGGRPKDCDWLYVCPLLGGSYHQTDDIIRRRKSYKPGGPRFGSSTAAAI